MTRDRIARDVVARVRRARIKRGALVVAALLVAALLIAFLAAAGVISLPLTGLPMREDQLWISQLTQADRLQELGYDGAGVTICLVDTGIDLIHPDLAGVHIVAWRDFISGRALPYDDGGHGTAMAGLIVADGRAKGIAPGASLIVAKALRSNGTGSSDTIGEAIGFCVDPNGDGDAGDGADIISLSLGAQRTPFSTNAASKAAEEAITKGVFVVSSAGNDGREDDGDVGTPADIPLVIAVGSLNHQLEVAAFSSKGNNSPTMQTSRVDPNLKPEFTLPGVGLVTTAMGASYTSMTGTSTSAALLSGLLALLLQAHPSYAKVGAESVVQMKNILMLTSLPLGGQETPHDDWYGYGLIQVYEAHLILQSGNPTMLVPWEQVVNINQ